MFGSDYSQNPEILLSSFGEMHKTYRGIAQKKKSKSSILQKAYLKILGIPEIGFQIRGLYFFDLINKNIGNKKIKDILDAGSGIGAYTFYLSKRFPKSKIIGGEIARDKLLFTTNFAKEHGFDNVAFAKFDVTATPKEKNKYELIVNIDVLEHIENYKKVLNNFYKLLKPGGYLYIHTPQPHQKRIFKQFHKWAHEDHVHEGYAPEDLRSTLEGLGFRIVELRQSFGFFGKLAWELNHMSFKKGFIVAGVIYPILYVIGYIDVFFDNEEGLGTAILAQKKN
jgi:SAM-dependent methyltransferase